jgi:hypothetical protein
VKFYQRVALAALALPAGAHAATEDFQTWNAVNFSTHVAKDVPVTLELSGRMVDDSGRLGVVIFRPAIGYKISDAVTVFVGYTHQKTINDGRVDVDENRIHQQVNWRIGKIGKATVASRTRIEQRWIAGARHGLACARTVAIAGALEIKGCKLCRFKRAALCAQHDRLGRAGGL